MANIGRGCAHPLRGVCGVYSGDPILCRPCYEGRKVCGPSIELDLIKCLGKVGEQVIGVFNADAEAY